MSEDRSLREIRLDKLARWRALGLDPYAVERFPEFLPASRLLAEYAALEGQTVPFAGRVVALRFMGKAAFAHLSDGEGRIQVYFRRDDLSPAEWEAAGLLDVGDHLGVHGELFTTKSGERSIHVRRLLPLSKSLQTLPLGASFFWV